MAYRIPLAAHRSIRKIRIARLSTPSVRTRGHTQRLLVSILAPCGTDTGPYRCTTFVQSESSHAGLERPASCGLYATEDSRVAVEVGFVPLGAEVRADYAVSATVPGPGGSAWTQLGRTGRESTLASPVLPVGSIVWVRLRSELTGSAPSPWTLLESVTL